MGKKIIVFTHVFPYAPPYEQFVEGEIKYLSNEFDEVFLLPVSRSANSAKCRTIGPGNVYVRRLARGNKLGEALKSLFSVAIFNRNFYSDIAALCKKGLMFNRLAILQLLTYHTNSYLIVKLALSQFKNLNMSTGDRVVLYSYWLSETAYACCLLKEQLQRLGYKDVRAVARAHGSFDTFISTGMKGFKPCIRYENQKLDRIFPVSKKGYQYLRGIGYGKELLKVGRIGVEKKMEIRDSGRPRDVFEIVSCSSVDRIKRVDRIVLALSWIPSLKIKWTHFGGGPLLDGVKLLCGRCLRDNIDWTLAGWTCNDSIIEYYKTQRPNLFVNVSEIEGIPASVMEAMSCGIPVIATDVGGSSEAVIDGVNGYLLGRDFDAEQLARLIIKVIGIDDYKYDRLCRNAWRIWDENFNAQKNYDQFAGCLLK